MHAYAAGLTGKQAAWAAKRYHGHRALPPDIIYILEEEDITRE